ncbi:MAG: Maf family protein [Gammaproteobacteria bacterium]
MPPTAPAPSRSLSGKAPIVVLASQSAYRRELLGRLLSAFETMAPKVDETRKPGEAPIQLARRLAKLKATAGAERYPGAIIVGSDQVAALDEETLGKPGTAERAVDQLLRCAGHIVEFHTAVCVVGPDGNPPLTYVDTTRAHFRGMSRLEAEAYVAADQPLDCAGSFKAEQRGVLLLDRLSSEDPTAIQGLPLIWLAQALRKRGVCLLSLP